MLIKLIKDGERAPYGFSRRWDGDMVLLRFPMFPWYGRRYRIESDDFRSGWWIKDLYLRFGTGHTAIGKG